MSKGQTKMRAMMKKFLEVTKKPKHETQNEKVDLVLLVREELTA